MITATLIHQINFPGTQNTCLYRFTIPSILATSISDEIKFGLNNHARIENLRISCSSLNYNFSLRLESGITPPSIEEIYDVVNANDTYLDNRVNVYWAKESGIDENNLYGLIKNLSGDATGIITFEFVLTCF